MVRIALILLALAALCAGASAYPSCLLQIPTSDVYDKDTGFIDIGATLYAGAHPKWDNVIVDTQFSTSHNLEWGYDFPANDPLGGVINAKWRFDGNGNTTGAVGFSGLEARGGLRPSLYAVGQRTHGKWCYHLGTAWDTSDQQVSAFGGISYAANDEFIWMADYSTGPAGYATAGFSTTFGEDDDWCFMFGYVRDNQGGGQGVYVDLGSLVTF